MLRRSGAWLSGDHFVFTNGNHSDNYVNKDALYPHPQYASDLGLAMASVAQAWDPDVVVSPAIGGIVLVQWTAYHLTQLLGREVLAVYAEKAPAPAMFAFTRGYDRLVTGKRVVALEDNLTTGRSVRKVVDLVRHTDGDVIGVVAMLNRGGVTTADVGNPPHFEALVNAQLQSWPAESCPLCAQGVPINTNIGKGKLYLQRPL